MRRLGGIATVVGLVALTAPAWAELPSDAPLPSCLDQSIKDELGAELRPRGVQAKDFLRQGRLQLTGRGGLFGGDITSSSWIAGGSLAFWFTEDLALEAGFEVTPIALDLDAPLAEFFGDARFSPGTGYLGLANLVWAPIHAKAKVGGGIVHADFLLYGGAGRLFHDSVQGVSFDVGLGIELLLSKYVTLRTDLRDVMAVQEAVAETRYTHNLVTTLGLSFWIPTPL